MTEPGAPAATTATSQGSQGDSRLRQRLIKKYCCKPRKVGSKGAVLVLIWSCLVSGSYSSTIKQLTYVKSIEVPQQVAFILYALFSPLAGWLADVYFGRYKVMRAGLWLMWVGSIAGVLAMIIKLELSETDNILYYSVIVFAAIVFTIGSTVFAVNAVPFGTDQMLDASTDEISAFIYWLVWSFYLGEVIARIGGDLIPACTHLKVLETDVLQSLIPVTLSSLALCCDFLLKGWLTTEPVGPNPFRLVLRVIKFAITHKNPIRRSAFTHCEDERPSRMDYAKSKYGGPFMTEEVEDVKTCLRMLVIVLCISTFLVPSRTYLSSVGNLYTHFPLSSECYDALIFLSYYSSSITVYSIPLYEILIHNVARKLIPSTMKRIGISIFLVIVLSIITLSIDTAGHLHNHSLPCMFRSNESSPVIETNYIWVDVFTQCFLAIALVQFDIALFEFICAQAPYNLKGLLIGLAYSVYNIATSLGYTIHTTWDLGWKKTATQPSCGFWYYLSITLTATLGLVIWCIVAKWYKRRERDEPAYEHTFVVDYYDKYCGTPSEINA